MISVINKFYKNLFFILILWFTLNCVHGKYLEDNYPESVIEDANLDTAQLIEKYKYPVETHYVTTKDNYILRMHRIPKSKGPPVLLMHGLEDSSATWIMMGPDKAPGYYLSDSGYDVWLGNARGNRYSRNHTTFNPDVDLDFWTFSWHEIGFYDLPALIDYILDQTGYKKIGYFGHSQGTTSFWVLCSMHPEYNNKITMMHALAPVAFMKHLKSPLIGFMGNFVKASKERFSEFLPHNELFYKMCFTSSLTKDTCMEFIYQIAGKDVEQINATMLPTIFGHVPAGCNIKQFEHYFQLIRSDRFCQYNYEPEENMKRFGKTQPPDYPLEKITVPVGLYYTYNDNLASELDVARLAKILPNVVEDTLYPNKNWNHLTMLWGIDARELAHKRMVEVMKNYSYE